MNLTVANILSYGTAAKEAVLFRNATKNVKTEQESLLKKILLTNQDTEYGKKHHFSEIDTYEQYRSKVPLVDYSDIKPHIQKILTGETNILFKGRPLCLQPTSGTTSGAKLIPFNVELQKQFQRGVASWIFDLFRHNHGLIYGRWFWSLSPAGVDTNKNLGTIPIGFPDDTAYLGTTMGSLLKASFAVPSEVGTLQDNDIFRYITQAFLLKTKNLVLISIWNPSYLLLLMESLDKNIYRIINDIQTGLLSIDCQIPKEIKKKIQAQFGSADRLRALELDKLYSQYGAQKDQFYTRIWPKLKLISVWESAEAKSSAARLKRLFPDTGIQPKGLVATEGIVTIPHNKSSFPLLSLRSHFYEFMPLENPLETVPAWKLTRGRLYKVVMTTAGGLYRYKLNDIVKVQSFHNECPALEFIGRGNKTSDFYGEKLHQTHISETIKIVFYDFDRASYYVLLAPDGNPYVDHYTLYLASETQISKKKQINIANRLEAELRKNVQYDYCRYLGQLKELEICVLPHTIDQAIKIYIDVLRRRGIKAGDIKPAVLDNKPVWKKEFDI